MNSIINDKEECVISVGAPGSVERVKGQYPQLIDDLNSLYFQAYDCYGKAIDEAIEMIRARGVRSSLETNSLLQASYYGGKYEL